MKRYPINKTEFIMESETLFERIRLAWMILIYPEKLQIRSKPNLEWANKHLTTEQ